jgi:hypothetical protein
MVGPLEARRLLSTTASLTPLADSYVSQSSPTINFGSSTALDVRQGSTAAFNSYLKFDLSSIVGSITSVSLKVFGLPSTSGSSVTVNAIPVPDTTWTESGVTWNTKPTDGSSTALSSATVTGTSGSTYTLDISDYAKSELALGDTKITIALESNAGTSGVYADFNSKEATSNKPALSVVTDVTTLSPSDNTYASDANPTTNYSTSSSLDVQTGSSGSNQLTFLKFNTASFSGYVGGALLGLYGVASSTADIVVQAYAIPSSTSWSQSTLNWNNKPAIDTTYTLPSITICHGTSAWYELDISDYVNMQRLLGNNTISLEIAAPSTTTGQVTFNSTRGTNKPQLMLTSTGWTTPTSVSTSSGTSVYWQSVFGASSYDIYRSTTYDSLGTYQTNVTTTSYTDTTTTGGPYFYSVVPKNACSDVEIAWGTNIPVAASQVYGNAQPDSGADHFKTIAAVWVQSNGLVVNPVPMPGQPFYSPLAVTAVNLAQFRPWWGTYVGETTDQIFAAALYGWTKIDGTDVNFCSSVDDGYMKPGGTYPTDSIPLLGGVAPDPAGTFGSLGPYSANTGAADTWNTAAKQQGAGNQQIIATSEVGFTGVGAMVKMDDVASILGEYTGAWVVTYEYT